MDDLHACNVTANPSWRVYHHRCPAHVSFCNRRSVARHRGGEEPRPSHASCSTDRRRNQPWRRKALCELFCSVMSHVELALIHWENRAHHHRIVLVSSHARERVKAIELSRRNLSGSSTFLFESQRRGLPFRWSRSNRDQSGRERAASWDLRQSVHASCMADMWTMLPSCILIYYSPFGTAYSKRLHRWSQSRWSQKNWLFRLLVHFNPDLQNGFTLQCLDLRKIDEAVPKRPYYSLFYSSSSPSNCCTAHVLWHAPMHSNHQSDLTRFIAK